MTASISELLAQRDALERQIRDAKSAERTEAINRIRRLMHEHGLTVADLAAPKTSVSTGKVAPKYRDPVSGVTWSGRGLKPKWLSAALESGKSVSDFVI